MLRSRAELRATGLSGVALKPTECDLDAVSRRPLPLDTAIVDFEGPDALPSRTTLERLSSNADLRVTVPVRADGFDPLGDDSGFDRLPTGIRHVLVAGNPAYLTPEEQRRAIAPRLGAALDTAVDPWVGTENIERIALATGFGQFELLGPRTERTVRALRDAGFPGTIAVYAPTVFSDEDDELLDAVGGYLARREPVRRQLPTAAPTDRRAAGQIRATLLDAVPDFVIAGAPSAIRGRVMALHEAGVDSVIAYPAQGPEALIGWR